MVRNDCKSVMESKILNFPFTWKNLINCKNSMETHVLANNKNSKHNTTCSANWATFRRILLAMALNSQPGKPVAIRHLYHTKCKRWCMSIKLIACGLNASEKQSRTYLKGEKINSKNQHNNKKRKEQQAKFDVS